MDADGPMEDGRGPDGPGSPGRAGSPNGPERPGSSNGPGRPGRLGLDEQESLPLDAAADGDGAGNGSDDGAPRPSWLDEVEGAPRRREPGSAEPERPGASPASPSPRTAGSASDHASTPARTSAPASGPDRTSAPDRATAPHRASAPARPSAPPPPDEEDELGDLRLHARHSGRADAEHGIPGPNEPGPTDSELELRDRCRAHFERWIARQKRAALERVSRAEEQATEKLGRVSLGLDRFQRLTNELIRLKARYSVRKEEVVSDLQSEGRERPRGIPNKVYAAALVFLAMVEFFANAPVFAALLPRDPLTERQIRVLTEMSEGWFAGAERVLAQIVFRPDAALLAGGVITFLLVLCHFFGSSLRELVMQREQTSRRYTVQGRSALENAVPLVLTSVGLILVLGVLYQSRIDLGDVGEERYTQDMEQVEEFRREAGWLRVDGELLAANDLTNRADDLQAAAVELREYSASMARMSFPILLLNLTLALAAISAAYFHRRDARREHFNDTPFEEERRGFIESAEEVADDVSRMLADVVRDIRELKSMSAVGPAEGWRSEVHRLESVLKEYRVENARARGIEPRGLRAFQSPPRLDVPEPEGAAALTTRSPEEYERERAELARRFDEVRSRFNDEATASW